MNPALQINRLSRQGWDRGESTALGRVVTNRHPPRRAVSFSTLSVPRRRRVCSVEGLFCMASAVSQLDVSDRAAYGAEGAATRRLCEERGAEAAQPPAQTAPRPVAANPSRFPSTACGRDHRSAV